MTENIPPARLLADTLVTLKQLGTAEREVFDDILRRTLEKHPDWLGFWSVWEPNALDGRDEEFVNQRGHDATGRYVPLWNRGRGEIAVEPNLFYETPGVGEFYLRPRRERRPSVIEPYLYPIAGKERLICSQVAPILSDGCYVGAAGVDVAVESVPAAFGPGDDNTLERLLGMGFVFLRDRAAGARISFCSERSRQLLLHYVGHSVEGELPPALWNALEHAGTDGRSAFRSGDAELLVARFEHASSGPGLWLHEQPCSGSTSIASGRCARLSCRESEVLDWLTQGKTNAEIGAILGISVHTVKRHVEKVLQKLGVPNRSAAAAASVRSARPPSPQILRDLTV